MNDFGAKLRKAREGRGISLRQIAAVTKISVTALEAIERNDVSRLPGGVFSRAFVRSYATEVGLDPDEVLNEFLDRFHTEPIPMAAHRSIPEDEIGFERRKRRAALVFVAAVVVMLVVGSILLYYLLQNRFV